MTSDAESVTDVAVVDELRFVTDLLRRVDVAAVAADWASTQWADRAPADADERQTRRIAVLRVAPIAHRRPDAG